MSIRAKLLAVVGLTAAGLMAVVLLMSHYILKPQADRHEAEQASNGVIRAHNALTNELSDIDAAAADRAASADVINALKSDHGAPAGADFSDDFFTRLRLSAVVVADPAGRWAYSKGFDRTSGMGAPVPTALAEHLRVGSPLLRNDTSSKPRRGILVLPGTVMLVAARPVLSGNGPSLGTVIMCRAFDEAERVLLSETTKTSLGVYPLYQTRAGAPFTLASFRRNGEDAILVRPLSLDLIVGCQLLKDVYGQPALTLEAMLDRQFYKQSRAATDYFLLSIIAVGLLLGFFAIVLVDELVVSRIRKLASFAKTIRADGDLSKRIVLKGSDEVASLARAVSGMMEALERDAVQRAEAEIALRQSEQKYRTLFDQMQSAFALSEIICDADGKPVDYRILEVNPAYDVISGLTKDQVVGRLASEVMPGLDQEWVDILGRVALTGEPVRFERYSKAVDKHLLLSAYCPKKGQFATTFIDETQRVKAAEELRLSEKRYRGLFNQMGSCVAVCEVVCDEHGAPSTYRYVDINPAHEAAFGQSRDEVVGKTIHEILPKVDMAWVRMLAEVAFTGRPIHFQKYSAGFGRHLQGSVYSIEPGKFATTFTDVTDAVRAQEGLAKERNLLRTLIDLLPDCIYALDADGKVILTNPADVRTVGVQSADEVIGKTVFDLFPARLAEKLWGTEKSVLTTGKPVLDAEEFLVTSGGEARWMLTSKVPLRDAEGRVTGLVSVGRDVTKAKRADEALRASEQRYRALAENSRDVIVRFDRHCRYLYANPAVTVAVGVDPGKVVGKTPREIGLPPEAVAWWDDCIRRVFESGKPVEGQLEQDGAEHIVFDWSLVPELDEHDKVVTVLATGRDITERRNLQLQLVQAQKMEAIGQLAGGIAHDFNNLLTGILGYANMLKLEADPKSDVHKAAETIEKAAERAAQLTKQLLGFARRGKFLRVPVNLNSVAHEVIALLGRTIDKNIQIVRRLSTAPAWVLGDPNQLEQAVLNLAVNSRDAMPDGGEISFETKIVDLDQEYCRTHSEATPGRFVRVSVADTGCGIPKDVQQRIFEPFFTTKDADKGTGMGLAMVYGIVRNHGGFLRLYSEVGQGARFDVYLPLSAADPASTQAQPTPLKGSGRILLVDDEEVIRNVAASMLRNLGYEVVTASGAEEAVECYRRQHDAIDLVVVDMVMPKTGGRECFRALREIDPSVRAVLSTGYGLNGKAQELVDEGMRGFVQKPYTLRDLSTAVAGALQAK